MKKGVLLVNLGSPDSPEPKDVKKYLGEFLMDERVIDVPKWARTLLVKGIILNTRPKASAKAYKKIWWDEGSPLIVLSERLQKKIQSISKLPISLAMRYGSMTILNGIKELVDQGITNILLFPLYPQFAMATTETISVLVREICETKFPNIKVDEISPFYNNSDYINVLSKSIKNSVDLESLDHLLFSYDGIPERHIRKSDITKSHCKIDKSCCTTSSEAHKFCYRHQCKEVTRLVADNLDLDRKKFSATFQSRIGFDPWLQPYTDRTIEKLGQSGIKKMAIATPAFVSDCLETLEEIAMEGAEIFEEVGGESFSTIPCLNDNQEWAELICSWIDNWDNKGECF